MIYTMTLFVYC